MVEEFLQGNIAAGKSLLINGLDFFAGYPITPSSETMEYLAFVMNPKMFVNAYSEVETINLLYGASSAGARTATATSGCGLSLMREGLSYMVGCHLPCVIYNVMRFSPGLGGITASNEDISLYWGVGHGESKVPILTPSTVQEIADCIMYAFDIADILRTPVIVMCDAILGQMYEMCEIHKSNLNIEKKWAVGNNKKNVITSRKIISYKTKNDEQEEQIKHLLEKEASIFSVCNEIMKYTELFKYNEEGKYITAIGTNGRVVQEVAEELGIGYFVPILLNTMNNDYDIKELVVVETGGKQLYDIIKYNYPHTDIKSIVFSHDIPDSTDIKNKMR